MLQNGFVDPWRFIIPKLKLFLFFPQVHQSYSRIDYFFVDGSLVPKVTSAEYHSIVISDHAPLSLNIQLSGQLCFSSPWRFNTLLLSDDAFNAFIMSSIDDFIAINKDDSVSYSLLWELLKAYLRGQIISYSAHRNTRKARLTELLTKIWDIDGQNAINPSQSLVKQRYDLQAELDLLTTSDTERLPDRSRATYYENGDKPSKLLAHQLKRQTTSRLIPHIKDSSGAVVSDPTSINDIFRDFYFSLYGSESSSDMTEITSFLQHLDIPKVDPTTANELDTPLNLEEIQMP